MQQMLMRLTTSPSSLRGLRGRKKKKKDVDTVEEWEQLGREWRNEGPCSRKEIEPSKGLEVKASERSRDCCRETELEQNCRRNEGKQQRCSTSGWQHFHLSNQTTHPPHSHHLSCQAGCLSAALCTQAIFTHFLYPSQPDFFQHTCAACTRTATHSLCLAVSVFPSGEWALQLGAKKCR